MTKLAHAMDLDKTSASPQVAFAEKFCWILFCATCVHLAFLQPYVVLVPAERTNLFSGLVCAFTLAVTLIVFRKGPSQATWPELGISIGLVALAGISAVSSSFPYSSLMRAIVLIASGLGGFWCARKLLCTKQRRNFFIWLCLANLIGVIVLSLWGYCDSGKIDLYLFSNPHQVINMVFLLIVSPLTLLAWRKPLTVALGVTTLGLCYLVLFLAGLQAIDSGVLITLGAVFVVSLLRPTSPTSAGSFFLLLVLVSGLTVFFVTHLSTKTHLSNEYQAYRLESYPFSWHVATKHPFAGIGLRAPRDNFLEDYQVRNPAMTKSDFSALVRDAVTSENTFLSFMVGLGFPFTALYVFALLVLLTRLVRNVLRPPPDSVLPSWALLVPIVAGLLHSLTTDTLMLPQLNWYFHILLGLISKPEKVAVAGLRGWKQVAVKIASAAAAVILGVFLGTHPFFSSEKIPSANKIRSYLRGIPTITSLHHEKPALPPAGKIEPNDKSSVALPAAQVPKTSKDASPPGELVVNIPGYKGIPSEWALMVIFDNSKSLAEESPLWNLSRTSVAVKFVENLSSAMLPGSQVAIRCFSSGIAAKNLGREIPFRVSRIMQGWSPTPNPKLAESLKRIQFSGENNLCAAAAWSLKRDFSSLGSRTPRILLLTDGQRACPLDDILTTIERGQFKDRLKVDIVGLGVPPAVRESLSKLASTTGGKFLAIDKPDDFPSALSSYLGDLQTPKLEHLNVSGYGSSFRVLPGEKLTLAPGYYVITLPEIRGLDPSRRTVEGTQVKSGETTVLDIPIRVSSEDQAGRE